MTKIKICGMQSVQDIVAAVENGADYIGFVFAPSKRKVTFEDARQLLSQVNLKGVKTVGVFVNPAEETVREALETVPLDYVQLHGDETLEFTAQFKGQVIKAFPSNSGLTYEEKFQYPAEFILIDSPRDEYYGGSGQTFDWRSLKQEAIDQARFALAGGLNSQNIRTAIEACQPALVDTSSGVETDGIKDSTKIKAFIEEVKGES